MLHDKDISCSNINQYKLYTLKVCSHIHQLTVVICLTLTDETALPTPAGVGRWCWTRVGHWRDPPSPGDNFPCSPSTPEGPASPLTRSSSSWADDGYTATATPLHLPDTQLLDTGLHGGGAWPSVNDLPVFLCLLFLYIVLFHWEPWQPGLPAPPFACRSP